MIFGHPSVQEASTLKSISEGFSLAAGPSVNKSKSQIFFFNTPLITQRNIYQILGFPIAVLPSKCLGAPLTDSVLKHSSWKEFLDKLESWLSLWTHRALNIASRLILVKYFLQYMPLYLFSMLAAPKWVLKAIWNLQRNFLWGGTKARRKWALVSWQEVCIPKKVGGPGLRDPHLSNKVMGEKIW